MVVAAPARAAIAADPARSRGRLTPEPVDPVRSPFRRDCDRIIHSAAFRRLAHKTQVFIFHEGDHFRTRLTHTLEVTQIARSLARALGLDEDLAEACALGHDLGHPPFGHAGERALHRAMEGFGGFDHNVQTLRVVTALERRYPAFDGLNLSWETLEGLVKHNGPLTDRTGAARDAGAQRRLDLGLRDFDRAFGLDLWRHPSVEAQIGAIADDIAYDAHDIDDGLRAGLFALDDLRDLPVIGDALRDLDAGHPGLDPPRRVAELLRRLITRMIEDVATRTRAASAGLSAEQVRDAGEAVAAFSPATAEADRAIKAFLYPRLYRSARVMEIMTDAERKVSDLFGHFIGEPSAMPGEWTLDLDPADDSARARRVADFIAGMTDRYALLEHARLFGVEPW